MRGDIEFHLYYVQQHFNIGFRFWFGRECFFFLYQLSGIFQFLGTSWKGTNQISAFILHAETGFFVLFFPQNMYKMMLQIICNRIRMGKRICVCNIVIFIFLVFKFINCFKMYLCTRLCPTAMAQELLPLRQVRQKPGVDHPDGQRRWNLLQRCQRPTLVLLFCTLSTNWPQNGRQASFVSRLVT